VFSVFGVFLTILCKISLMAQNASCFFFSPPPPPLLGGAMNCLNVIKFMFNGLGIVRKLMKTV
jgi:hypothetical protein